MRTTIELPDELFRMAKSTAALRGLSLKELVKRLIEQGLTRDVDPPKLSGLRRDPPPLFFPPTGRTLPMLTNAELQEILDVEDAARGWS